MKDKVIAVIRAISPRLADRVIGIRRSLAPSNVRNRIMGDRLAELESAVDALTLEVRELQEEIDESRRDALRVAELADIVEHQLAAIKFA